VIDTMSFGNMSSVYYAFICPQRELTSKDKMVEVNETRSYDPLSRNWNIFTPFYMLKLHTLSVAQILGAPAFFKVARGPYLSLLQQ
jgi:hypothetical protein